MTFKDRVTESEVQEEILRALQDGRIWSNANLKRELRNKLLLSKEDKTRANRRPNERKWESLVNNALSPSRSNSLYAKGFVVNRGRGRHQITSEGLDELKRLIELYNSMESIYEQLETNKHPAKSRSAVPSARVLKAGELRL